MKRTCATARLAAFLSVLSSAVLLPAISASAAPAISPLQQQINKQLQITHGGVQVSDNTVSYNSGSVFMVLPEPGSKHVPNQLSNSVGSRTVPEGVNYAVNNHGCPSGHFTHWYCFYDDVNFGGRMLMFKDCGDENSILVNLVNDLNFGKQASSWINTSRNTIQVFASDQPGGGWGPDGPTGPDNRNGNILWTEYPGLRSSWVGPWANDRAISFSCWRGVRKS